MYTMNVLHAAIAVQSERQLKLQTEVAQCTYINLHSLLFHAGPGAGD